MIKNNSNVAALVLSVLDYVFLVYCFCYISVTTVVVIVVIIGFIIPSRQGNNARHYASQCEECWLALCSVHVVKRRTREGRKQ